MSPTTSDHAGAPAQGGQPDKWFATLAARAALRGWRIWRTAPADGDPRYFATRWGMTRTLGSPAEVDAFLCQVGA